MGSDLIYFIDTETEKKSIYGSQCAIQHMQDFNNATLRE